MGRYSTNLNTYAKTSIENEVCPFCNHHLPVGVTECKCGAKLAEGGPDMERKRGQRKGILFGFAFSSIALIVISGLGPRANWWAWMVPVGFMIFLFLVWPKMGKAWFRNGEVGFRQIWIDE